MARKIPLTQGKAALKLVRCLFGECDRAPAARGLCRKHYSVASRLVHKCRTTWAALEASGKAAASAGVGSVAAWFLAK